MKIPQFTLDRQTPALAADLKRAVGEVIDSNEYAYGKKVREFEEKWAAANNMKYCVAVNNGTTALHLALLALDNHKEVVTTPASFIATSEAIFHAGKQIRYVDIDETCNLDPNLLPEDVNGDTVLLPVALYGNPSHFDKYLQFANRKGCRAVVGDFAQSHGAKLNGKHLAEYTTIGCFSFYPTKILGACGEAGAIVTNNETLYKKAAMISSHGQSGRYQHEIVGHNFRLSDIIAATLLVKLPYLEEWIDQRRAIAARYRENLIEKDSIYIPYKARGGEHSYHQFVINIDRRDKCKEYLEKYGVGTTVHYPYAISSSKPFQTEKEMYYAEDWKDTCLSLPMFPELKMDEVDYVCEKLINFIKLYEY